MEMDGKRVARVKIQRVRSPETEGTPSNTGVMLQLAKDTETSSGDSH
jgi:hypothetical protein